MKRYLMLILVIFSLQEPITAASKSIIESDKEIASMDSIDAQKLVSNIAKQFLKTNEKNLIDLGISNENLAMLEASKKDFSEFNIPKKTIIERIIIPAKAKIYVIGDLHGDWGQIQALLNTLKATGNYDPKTGVLKKGLENDIPYIIFLGDYIDRGKNSLKILSFLTTFKNTNPDYVHLIRGNHEDFIFVTGYAMQKSKFAETLKNIFGSFGDAQDKETYRDFFNAFQLLPSLLFVDRIGQEKNPDYRMAFMHGAPEFSFRWNEATCSRTHGAIKNLIPSKKILIQDLAQPEPNIYDENSQYLWSDLRIDGKTPDTYLRGRGYTISAKTLREWMQKQNVAAVFRGHQQANQFFYKTQDSKYRLFSKNNFLFGIGYREGFPQAFTLNVAPRSGYHHNKTYFTKYGTLGCIQPQEENGKIIYKLAAIYFTPRTGAIIPNAIITQKTNEPTEAQKIASFTHNPQDQDAIINEIEFYSRNNNEKGLLPSSFQEPEEEDELVPTNSTIDVDISIPPYRTGKGPQ